MSFRTSRCFGLNRISEQKFGLKRKFSDHKMTSGWYLIIPVRLLGGMTKMEIGMTGIILSYGIFACCENLVNDLVNDVLHIVYHIHVIYVNSVYVLGCI